MADFRKAKYSGSLNLAPECGPVLIELDTEAKTATASLEDPASQYTLTGGGGGSLEVIIPEQTVTTVLSHGQYGAALSVNEDLAPDKLNITFNGETYNDVELNGYYYGDLTFENYPFVISWSGGGYLFTSEAATCTVKAEGIPKTIKFGSVTLTINVAQDSIGKFIDCAFPYNNGGGVFYGDFVTLGLNAGEQYTIDNIMFSEDAYIRGVIQWDADNITITNKQNCETSIGINRVTVFIIGENPSFTIKVSS